MAEMTVAATREKEEAGEVRHELSSLKKMHTETVAQLEAVRKDKGSLQVPYPLRVLRARFRGFV